MLYIHTYTKDMLYMCTYTNDTSSCILNQTLVMVSKMNTDVVLSAMKSPHSKFLTEIQDVRSYFLLHGWTKGQERRNQNDNKTHLQSQIEFLIPTWVITSINNL